LRLTSICLTRSGESLRILGSITARR
jgi:hypothetical protein